jgi:hypothetical protein
MRKHTRCYEKRDQQRYLKGTWNGAYLEVGPGQKPKGNSDANLESISDVTR